jgi:hypothetical protein
MMTLYPGKMGPKCLFMSSLTTFENSTISLERSDCSTWGNVLDSNKKSSDYILSLKHKNVKSKTKNNKEKKKKIKPSGLILKLVGNL